MQNLQNLVLEEGSDSGLQTPIPVFNEAAMLARFMGDASLAARVVDAFMGDMPKQIQLLGEGFATANTELIGKLAHKIKGAAATVGAERMSTVACKIEMAGKNGDLAGATAHLSQLGAEFDKVKTATSQARRPQEKS